MSDHEHTTAVAVSTLRLLLGVLFLWLGLLKVAGYGPQVLGMETLPYFGFSGTEITFGVLEAVIGLLLIINILWSLTEALLVVYMFGTLLVLAAIPEQAFTGTVLRLTVLGELVLKNLALGIAGVSLLVHEQQKLYRETHPTEQPEHG